MSGAFVETLMREGRLQVEPAPRWHADAHVMNFLATWGQRQAMHLAGPALELDVDLTVAGVDMLYRAAWFFLQPEQPAREIDFPFLTRLPRCPADHFAADLALRFLAGLWQRAQGRESTSLLKIMEKVLRRWPLSGVLTKIWEPPESPIEMGGHAGLSFLYAERLARQYRPAWLPAASALPFMELVWTAQGKDWPIT